MAQVDPLAAVHGSRAAVHGSRAAVHGSRASAVHGSRAAAVRPRDAQRPVRRALHPVRDRRWRQVQHQVARRVRPRGRRQVRGGGQWDARSVGERQPGPPPRPARRLDLARHAAGGRRHGGERGQLHAGVEGPVRPALHRPGVRAEPAAGPAARVVRAARAGPDARTVRRAGRPCPVRVTGEEQRRRPCPVEETARQPQHPPLLRAGAASRDAAVVPRATEPRAVVRLDQGREPGDLQPEPAGPVVEHGPPPVAQITHQRLLRARVHGAYRHPPYRSARGDHQSDQPSAVRRGQPVRVEDHLEARVVVTVQLLTGVHGRLRRGHGPRRHGPHPAAPLGPDHAHPERLPGRPGGEVAQIGVTAQPQHPVRAPASLHQPRHRRYVAACEPGARAAHAGVHRAPTARQPFDGERARAVGPFEGEHGQQILQPPLAHQAPLDPQLHRQTRQHPVPGPVQESARPLEERCAVRLPAHRQTVQEVAEVVPQAGRVVGGAPVRVPVAEEGADLLAGGDPVAYAGDVGAPPGDRALPHAPVVDVFGQDVDGAGEIVRRDHHRGVLVQPALGEGEGVAVPEGAPEHLVPRHPVGEQARVPGDVRPGPGAGQPAVLPCLLPAPAGQPPHVAGRQIRTGRLQRRDHPLVRVVDDDVVAVRERQVGDGPGGVPDARVAGRAQTGVRLPDEPEAAVPGRELRRDPAAAVRRAVVDEHHLDRVERLLSHRAQTVSEVVLDVVNRDDDAEEWLHALVNRGRVRGSPALTRSGERGPSAGPVAV
ncbi:hypothetical protein EES43_10415 [Streptomyces sp. ADI96-02]|nr:hypothetical protein EES43_10415 [Streptomyces sp. ADI96-02]